MEIYTNLTPVAVPVDRLFTVQAPRTCVQSFKCESKMIIVFSFMTNPSCPLFSVSLIFSKEKQDVSMTIYHDNQVNPKHFKELSYCCFKELVVPRSLTKYLCKVGMLKLKECLIEKRSIR